MSMNAKQILDREFLELRAKILELAASFDRLDRAQEDDESGTDISSDPRLAKLAEGVSILNSIGSADRAERVQMLFSLPYTESWREDFRLTAK